MVAVDHLFPARRAGIAGIAALALGRGGRARRRVRGPLILPMDFDESFDQVIDFVRDHAAWAPPIVFVARVRGIARLHFAAGAGLGRAGRDRRADRAERHQFWPVWIAGCAGRGLRRLAVLLGRPEARILASRNMWPLSRHPDLIPRGEAFVKKWGVARHFHRPFFRAVARRGAAGRRHFRNAVSGDSRSPISPRPSVWAAVLLALGDVIGRAIEWMWP